MEAVCSVRGLLLHRTDNISNIPTRFSRVALAIGSSEPFLRVLMVKNLGNSLHQGAGEGQSLAVLLADPAGNWLQTCMALLPALGRGWGLQLCLCPRLLGAVGSSQQI